MRYAPTMRKIFTAAIIAALMCASCGQQPSRIDHTTTRRFAGQMTYFKDSRTDLCFATVASRGDFDIQQTGLTITYVPCTPKVEGVIQLQEITQQ